MPASTPPRCRRARPPSPSLPPSPNGLVLSWLHLPLTLAAALLVFLLVRAVPSSLSRRLRLCAPKDGIAVPVEKPAANADLEKSSKPSSSSSWFSLNLGFISWETLPTTIAESLPITLHPPPAPAMRGRHVYRGGRGVGFFHPSTSNTQTQRTMVEAPHASIYDSQTPVSMAKMIMSRHVRAFSFSRLLPLSFLFFCARVGGSDNQSDGVICVEWRGGAGATSSIPLLPAPCSLLEAAV
ncbi:hypothetical protein B0H14DRAFT_505387 [Mycena olivaceomarginata]|nr:hypothetical protein B0H14DRAFT_505387 [Mycena olivaceomarginata]